MFRNQLHRHFAHILRNLGIMYSLSVFLGFAPAFGQSDTSPADDDKTIKKGRGYISLSFSLDQRNAENESQLFRQVIDQDKLNYRVTTNGGYAIMDNFTLGLGLSYGRKREDVNFLNDDNVEVTSRFLQNDISFIPNMRNYIPLGDGSLQIFVQTDMRFTFSESLRRDFYPDEVDKFESDVFEYRLGVSPGALLFFDRNWAFEVSVGLAGLTSRFTSQILNDDLDNQTRIVKTDIDLRLNLLALNLGVARYF